MENSQDSSKKYITYAVFFLFYHGTVWLERKTL